MRNSLRVLVCLSGFCLALGAVPSGWANTYQVTNPADDGSTTSTANTLRWAVASANGHAGFDTITFALGGNSITALAPLLITDSVYIQGNRTEIIGGVNTATNLLIVGGGGFNSTVSGLALVNAQTGLLITSTSGCAVVGCAIGTDWSDSPGKGNVIGISLSSAVGAIIGQSGPPTVRNIISGNGRGIFSSNSRGTLVQNNYIGLKSDGVNPLPNTSYGIHLGSNTWSTQVGGDLSAGEGNVVSGNAGFGVMVEGPNAGGNTVCGNIIGLNAGQSGKQANTYGVVLRDTTGNAVGLPQPGYGNVISGNTWAGVLVQNVSAVPRCNVIQNNLIGTNSAGAAGLGNGMQGVNLSGDANLVGGRFATAWYERNWVCGNGSTGIALNGNGNTVSGNSVGLTPAGAAALANSSGGVSVSGNGNLIGGQCADAATNRGNLVSGNLGTGIVLNAAGTGNTLAGNVIGLNEAGTAGLANSAGIYINSGAAGFYVGGPDATWRNLISGNAGTALYLGFGGGCAQGQVQSNWIGCDQAGVNPVLNGNAGIFLNQAVNCLIGGTAPGTGNVVVAGGSFDGIDLFSNCAGNTLVGNVIGRLPYAAAPAPLNAGVNIYSGSAGNWVGLKGVTGNLITNANHGLYLDGLAVNNPFFGNTVCGISSSPIYLPSGANHNKLSPVITQANPTLIRGNAEIGDYVEIFISDKGAGYPGGSLRLLDTALANGSGIWMTNPTGLVGGEIVTAIATNANNDSSDFAINFQVTPPSPTVSPTATVTPTCTKTPTASMSATPSLTRTPSATVTPTMSVSATASRTPSATTSATLTPTLSITPTVTVTPTVTPLPSHSPTPFLTFTPTASPTATPLSRALLSPGATVDATGSLTPLATGGKDFLAFPNPARDHARIVLKALDHAGEAEVVICNLSGEYVAVLRTAVRAGSGQSLVWDCGSVAPGIYLLRITLDGQEVGKGKIAIAR